MEVGPRFTLPNGECGTWAVRVRSHLFQDAKLEAVRCINDRSQEIYPNLAEVLSDMVACG